MRIAAGALLTLLLVDARGAGGRVDHVVQLPGFTLALPAGQVVRSTTLPSAGSHVETPAVEGVENALISVYWAQHGKSHADWVAMNRDKVFGSLVPGVKMITKEENVAKERWVGSIGGDGEGGAVGIVTCEPGFSIMFMVNVSKRIAEDQRVAREIAKSVQCAFTDANRHKPDATVRLSRRFARVPNPDQQQYFSLDEELIMVNIVPGNSFANGSDALQAMMLGIMSKSVSLTPAEVKVVRLQDTELSDGKRLVVRFLGDPKIERRYIAVQYCKDMAATINVALLMPSVEDVKALQLLDGLSCPGGESSELGDIHDIALDGCAAGHRMACELREML
jgi:hypothetical protein